MVDTGHRSAKMHGIEKDIEISKILFLAAPLAV